MASNVTLLQLRTGARQRADQENSDFVSDSELNSYINSSAKELYDLLIQANEFYYFLTHSLVVDGSSSSFALPSDFYKIAGIDYTLGGRTRSMDRYNFAERNLYRQGNGNTVRYMVQANNISFLPIPPAQTMTLYYAPCFTNLVDDDDTFDGVNGWEEYIIVDAARKCKLKEESDTRELLMDKAAIIKRIEAMSADRDHANPARTVDVKGRRFNRWDDDLL